MVRLMAPRYRRYDVTVSSRTEPQWRHFSQSYWAPCTTCPGIHE
ncbi:hypothetical protein BSU04_16325 [Caballeronia sordidicola]|uniref:Uncharacterized protein n=1 Tax=Caballeronia sordidicola TaxID=196367 RepID=A0A226X3D1_CABSO|nr:hypothetical protein BSU04_16325 [Caballeronia sordidicola]